MSFFYKNSGFFFLLCCQNEITFWNCLFFFCLIKKLNIIVSSCLQQAFFFLIYRKKRKKWISITPHSIPISFSIKKILLHCKNQFTLLSRLNFFTFYFGLLFLLLLYAVGIKYKRKDEKIRWYITNIFFLLIFSALSHFLLIARSLFKANMEYTFNKKPHLMYY